MISHSHYMGFNLMMAAKEGQGKRTQKGPLNTYFEN